jgi:integrative and conjugative element protein (TIGR02256 family)
MTALVFSRGRERVKLDAAVVAIMRCFRQADRRSLEAGGVLLGRWLADTPDIVVDHLTTPMRGDRRSRFAFHRHRRRHQERIDEVHAATNGTCGYLGEWHTHPEKRPTPSQVDLDDWSRRLRLDATDVDLVLFVIVGTTEIALWSGSRSTSAIEEWRLSDVVNQDPAQDRRRAVDASRWTL